MRMQRTSLIREMKILHLLLLLLLFLLLLLLIIIVVFFFVFFFSFVKDFQKSTLGTQNE